MTQKVNFISNQGEVELEYDFGLVTTCIHKKETKTMTLVNPEIIDSASLLGLFSNTVYSTVSTFLMATESVEMSPDFRSIFEDFLVRLESYDRNASFANLNRLENDNVH